jgi:CheY-like chemotaxis protein
MAVSPSDLPVLPKDGALVSLRVLVVEDETLVALLLEDMLADLGCIVIGPATSVEVALALLETEPVDVALIDVSLGSSELSLPVADALVHKRIPFAFASGHGPKALGGTRHEGASLLLKPFSFAELTAIVVELGGKTRALPG